MTEPITSKEYFFAAYKNPFANPARIAVDSSNTQEVRDRQMKVIEDGDAFPKYLKALNIRVMVLFLVYIVATVTVIPLIVLTWVAFDTVKQVQTATDLAADNDTLERRQQLHAVRAKFSLLTGYTGPAPTPQESTATTPSSGLSSTASTPTVRNNPFGSNWGALPASPNRSIVEEEVGDFGLPVPQEEDDLADSPRHLERESVYNRPRSESEESIPPTPPLRRRRSPNSNNSYVDPFGEGLDLARY